MSANRVFLLPGPWGAPGGLHGVEETLQTDDKPHSLFAHFHHPPSPPPTHSLENTQLSRLMEALASGHQGDKENSHDGSTCKLQISKHNLLFLYLYTCSFFTLLNHTNRNSLGRSGHPLCSEIHSTSLQMDFLPGGSHLD